MTEPNAQVVTVERRRRILIITINRPAAKNAINAEVARHIAAAVDELDASPELRAGVITGAGGNFSAGMDLKAFVSGESPFIDGRGLCGISVTPPRKPLLAAVEGWALAGGFELLLACDLIYAGEGARFGVPEVKRGLVAAAGGAYLLPQRISSPAALELLLTGDPIGADRALALGLVTRVTPDGGALEEALRIADRIAANGPLALEVTKQIARSAETWGTVNGWAAQDAMAHRAMTSRDAAEGATAFAEKRPPVWQGR